MAKHLARRFDGRGELLNDLAQIATIGLIKAIDRFDPDYGNDFASDAVPTIVGEIKRHFRDHTWDVRVPRRPQELKLAINNATAALAQSLGRSPTVADIAAYLERGEEEIIDGWRSCARACDPRWRDCPYASGRSSSCGSSAICRRPRSPSGSACPRCTSPACWPSP